MTNKYLLAILLLHDLKRPITEESVTEVLTKISGSCDPILVAYHVAVCKSVGFDTIIEAIRVTKEEVRLEPLPEPTKEEKPKTSEEPQENGLTKLFGDM
jgi:ribosomal protein L12E/L44/L45/RPP1/RPP2